MKKVLTWIKPTWNGMHIGNYFGAFKPFIELAKWKEAFIFIADFHSLTSVHDWEVLRKNKLRLLKEYFALLPKDSEIIVYEQSKINRINDITWILSSITPYSLMLRAHAFKDSEAKNSEINMAVFNYPILMTSDIITYDTDIVPVWKDQIQHIEFARDIAGNFNKNYKTDLFKLPTHHIEKELQTIPGTDWRKMSKSYNNFIWIFDDEKVLKKKIMSIVTDTKWLEEPKNPETCNVFALIKLFAGKTKQDEIASKYRAGNYWYGHAKLELFDIILDYFKDARKKYASFENDMSYIEKKLEEWNKLANQMADSKYDEILKVIGL